MILLHEEFGIGSTVIHTSVNFEKHTSEVRPEFGQK